MSYMGYGAPPPVTYVGGYPAPAPVGVGYGAPAPVGVGYGAPAPVAAGYAPSLPLGPPDADPQLWSWFNAVNADRSGSITVVELQRALDNGDWAPFDLDTIKLLMNLFDVDRNGVIGFREFSGIWRYIKDWQNAFRHFDRDRSGSVDANELRAALHQFGYHLTPQLIHLIERKYAPPVSYGVNPGISFDRFVRACVVVKQTTESFKSLDTNSDGWITIGYDRFMEIVLSLP